MLTREEPSMTAPDELLLQVLRVGICGTDREEAGGGRAEAEDGQSELIIGHEMLGRVVAVGEEAVRVQVGDYAVFTVRRGCGKCMPCAINRPDMCRTGQYRERGIWGLDGYQAEFVADKEQYAVRVPPDLRDIGVLVEPLSVAEKAIDEAIHVQSTRLPDVAARPDWPFGCRCLVAGLGPIGLLAAMALRLRGAEVYGLDVVDTATPRPDWLARIGGHYVDGRQIAPDKAASSIGPIELTLEATGVPSLAFNLLEALAPSGVCVFTGIPGGDRPIQLPASRLLRDLVLGNQVMVGSVNAAVSHYEMAVTDLVRARASWGNHVDRLISHHYPYADTAAAFETHVPEEIKAVVEWASP